MKDWLQKNYDESFESGIILGFVLGLLGMLLWIESGITVYEQHLGWFQPPQQQENCVWQNVTKEIKGYVIDGTHYTNDTDYREASKKNLILEQGVTCTEPKCTYWYIVRECVKQKEKKSVIKALSQTNPAPTKAMTL